jgi:hypothetical protein
MAFAQPDTPITTTGGSLQPYSDAWYQNQANLIRSNTLSRELTQQSSAFLLQQLGKGGYMNLFPETFLQASPGESALHSQILSIEGEIADREATIRQLGNDAGSAIPVWMLRNEISDLRGEISFLQHGRQYTPQRATPPPPSPTWLQPYLEASKPYQMTDVAETRRQIRGKTYANKGTTASLRPLGAQAELTPEQLAFMSSYQAWGKAGSPRTFARAGQMTSNWQNWWDEYTTQSQKLFPTAGNRAASWATARQ